MRKFITDILAKANLGVEQNAYVLGTVGIGTSSASAKLDISVTPSTAWMNLINGDETAFRLTTYNNGTSSGSAVYAFKHGLYYGTTENTAVTFYRGGSGVGGFLTFTTNNGAERMRIDSDGNVGIGTTSPAVKLEVIGVGSFNNAASSRKWLLDATNGVIQHNYNGTVETQIGFSGGTTYFLGQNVGIGTTSPAAKLHIAGGDVWINTVSTLQGMQFGYSGPSHGSYRAAVMGGPELYGGTDSGMLTFHTQNGYVVSATPPERMRITSSGNVGIGTTSPVAALHVQSSSTKIFLSNTDFVSNTTGSGIILNTGGSSGKGPNQGAGKKKSNSF